MLLLMISNQLFVDGDCRKEIISVEHLLVAFVIMKHGFLDSYTGQSFYRHLNQRELNTDKNQSSTKVQH